MNRGPFEQHQCTMRIHHFLQIILLSAIWGGTFVLLRVATPAVGVWGVAGIRSVLALLMLGTRHRWPHRSDWLRLALVSLLTVVATFVLFPLASLTLPAGYSAVLNTTAPLFGMLAASAMGEERLTARRLLGCVVGLAGVVLLVGLGPVEVTFNVVLAALACTAAAASYGIGATLMKRAATRHDPLPVAAAVHVAASLMLLVPLAATAPRMHFTLSSALALLVLGTFTSGFMYWISLRLMREISATAAMSSAFMIPLFGVTWGYVFLGEPVTTTMIPGVLLVLVATLMVTGFNPFRGVPAEP